MKKLVKNAEKNEETKAPKKVGKKSPAETTPVEPEVIETESGLNEAEKEVIEKDGEEVNNIADTEVMRKTLALVARKFNLDHEFVMTAFSDQGLKVGVTMNSRDFEVTVKIKDVEKQGLRVPENSK